MKRKIIYALLSIVAAFGLWLYVITAVSPEYEDTFSDISVELKNDTPLHDRNLMVLMDKLPTVTLKLSGNRSDLSKLNSGNIKLQVDLSRIYEAGEQEVAYTIRYPDNMPSNSFEILSQDPGVVKLNIVERTSVTVPIQGMAFNQVADGYIADKENLTMSADSVTLTGPASVVNKIKMARVMIDLKGKDESISQEYPLEFLDENGSKVEIGEHVVSSVEAVHVNLKIEFSKVIDLVVNVIPGGGATADNTKVKLNYNSITVSGSKHLLDQLQSLQINIDLGMIEESVEDMPIVVKLPEGVTNVTGNVLATIDMPKLKTKMLNVTHFVAQSVASGLQAEFITKSLEVTLRGDPGKIDQLTAGDIVVVVDFSQVEPGEMRTIKPQIRIEDERFAGIGAIGVGNVTVELQLNAGI